jgi:rod shape determining protein RodA
LLSQIKKYLNFDWYLLITVIFLLTFGMSAIYSLSLANEGAGINNFMKQGIFLGIGLLFFLFFSFVDYRIWKNYSNFFYLLGIVLLLAVLYFGEVIHGTSGWFSFGFFNFQPVEIMKVFMILFLANYFSKHFSASNIGIKQIVVSFLYTFIPVFLVVKQPDLASSMVLIVIWLGMLFLAGAKKKYVLGIFFLGIILSLLSWNLFLKDYQKERIQVFMNAQEDPQGSGYNVIQSMVAIGSGGTTGKGLGYGSQSQLNFLPERHTDFIFAAIAEENGALGVFILITLFGVFFYRLKKIADSARDNFGQLIVGGVLVMFFFQIVVNVGMNLGIMPVAGISLPFVSYGGSYLMTSMICLGLVQSVWIRRKKDFSVSESHNEDE